ncbi:MAG: hypothetical protein KDA45_15420, partial [Planctomycetales bacterium]|nr:hypothetical protein [Planctomycetales bacterium]
ELNTWLATAARDNVNYAPSDLLRELPQDLLAAVGNLDPVALQCSYSDVDYLYQCRLTKHLAEWIVQLPLRDSLLEPLLDQFAQDLSPADRLQLFDAYKLFDWTIRNVALESNGSNVEATTRDPRGPVDDSGLGYGYLPWETLLFSSGDFIERGRVFSALAAQRGIDTAWISVGDSDSQPGNLWTIAVLIADEILLFEPKLGLPILEPDQVALATLQQARDNERILRRLDLPGKFDYAFAHSDLQSFEFLIDAPPVAASARMKMLEQALLRDERMVIYQDLDRLRGQLQKLYPEHAVHLWQTPLLAQVQAATVRERLQNPSPYSMNYMAMHGVWLLENPAATGRLKHLFGEFENTLDGQGALSMYMNSRIDELTIEKLAYDPEVRHELGIAPTPGESKEQYGMRIQQAQYIFGRSKVDAAFLMAQLHFDRGNYSATQDWLKKRVLGDTRAENWWPAGHYTLARALQESGDLEQAVAELAYQPSPQEAGNRLRARYLRREP